MPEARFLTTETPQLFAAAVREAALLLQAGQVVALPTETVYGLAANALNARAVERIFAIKGRPAHNPIIVHVAGLSMAHRCVADWPVLADKLATAFWPGPLTMVLVRSREIPDVVTAGGPTVGVRWPSHRFIQAVLRDCGFPLAVPSANRSTELSPTTAEHVRKSLGSEIPLIVDGGPAQVGIESTVLDISVAPPVLLRPGMIHMESLLAVTGELSLAEPPRNQPYRSPGLLLKHYAPKARLIVLSWLNEEDLRSKLRAIKDQASRIHIISHTNVPHVVEASRVAVIPHDPEAFARAIYGELHRCDEAGADLIVIEALPNSAEWQGIADRLRRASS
jgi:L-threonylcarbamoyladenylate synthase